MQISFPCFFVLVISLSTRWQQWPDPFFDSHKETDETENNNLMMKMSTILTSDFYDKYKDMFISDIFRK